MDIQYVKECINKFYDGRLIKEADPGIRHFENIHQWWDLDMNNIDSQYFTIVEDKEGGLVGYEVWVFITKEKDGHCILYISY